MTEEECLTLSLRTYETVFFFERKNMEFFGEFTGFFLRRGIFFEVYGYRVILFISRREIKMTDFILFKC